VTNAPAIWFEFAVAVGVTILSALLVRGARAIALKKILLDLPNDRSSHVIPVPRLGGVGLVVALMIGAIAIIRAMLMTPLLAVFSGGLVVLFVLGLIDDLKPLSSVTRLLVHFVVAAMFVAEAFGSGGHAHLGVSTLSAILTVIWIVGVLNIYNFMDGIDGIAGTQALVAGVAWFALATAEQAPLAAGLGLVTASAALGFLFLNWPPARIFMGDAGSTVLGYIFATLPILVRFEAPSPPPLARLLAEAALVVWPFLVDGTFTIARRLLRGENPLRAHRSHVYQRLVISGLSHRIVTSVYGAAALLGALLAWGVEQQWIYGSAAAIVMPLVVFAVLWWWAAHREAAAETPHA